MISNSHDYAEMQLQLLDFLKEKTVEEIVAVITTVVHAFKENPDSIQENMGELLEQLGFTPKEYFDFIRDYLICFDLADKDFPTFDQSLKMCDEDE